MFNKEQLKYLLETTRNINYENFYKTDLITMIKILQEKIDNAIEITNKLLLNSADNQLIANEEEIEYFNALDKNLKNQLIILKGSDK